MNPSQLRESTIDPLTRRLVQLTILAKDNTDKLMDMLLAEALCRSARVAGTRWQPGRGGAVRIAWRPGPVSA
jgi:hypothetical protein